MLERAVAAGTDGFRDRDLYVRSGAPPAGPRDDGRVMWMARS